MNISLSPQNEQVIRQLVERRYFPSTEAALDAAIELLREDIARIPPIPAEHLELVEAALASSAAGHSRPMTEVDWERLHQKVRGIAAMSAATDHRG